MFSLRTLSKHTPTAAHGKRVINLLPLFLAFVLLLAACSPATSPSASPSPEAASVSTEEPIQLTIGVSPVPHGDILKFIQENLAADAGLELTLVEFTDYVQPNLALADGTIDANFFQHVPYMEDFAKEHNLDLVAVVAVHIEPLGIYSNKITTLEELSDGAVVAIPNDTTNGGRALKLLEANGLLTLKEGVGYAATVQDIVDNPLNLDIKELEAAQLVRALDDVSIAVINGNFAIEAGLKPATQALALESGLDNPYANILTVLKGRETDPGILKLAELLTSPEVKQFIEEKYEGAVIPAF
jgi:D-methionine transport system substrate-binding protein